VSDILGTVELAAIRATIETTMPDTCYVLRGTAAVDGQGFGSMSWATVGTASCRLDMNSGRESTTAGAIQPYSTYVLSVKHNTSILTKDRIVYGGSTFNVTSVNSGSWLGVKRAVLEKI